MKTKLFVKAVIFMLAAFTLSYLCYSGAEEVFEQKGHLILERVTSYDFRNYKTYSETLPSFKGVDRVVIQSANASLELRGNRVGMAGASLTTAVGRPQAFHSQREGNKLVIKLDNLSSHPFSTLTLDLPDSVKSIQVISQAGDIELRDLGAKEAKIQAINGDIKSDSPFKELKAKTVNGDIRVSTSAKHPQYQLETVSGDIHLRLPHTSQAALELQSANGEVDRAKARAKSSEKTEGSIVAKSVNGDIRVEE